MIYLLAVLNVAQVEQSELVAEVGFIEVLVPLPVRAYDTVALRLESDRINLGIHGEADTAM